MTLDQKVLDLRKQLLSKNIDVNQLDKYQQIFEDYYNLVMYPPDVKKKYTKEGLFAFLQLCNDFYTFSNTGGVLISDHQYDEIMQVYQNMGNPQLIYPDAITNATSTWELVKHKAPFMVGSIAKVYDEDSIYRWLNIISGSDNSPIDIMISPKYDGVSCCLEMFDHECMSALTRYNGQLGFDITAVIKNASNYADICRKFHTGYLKSELLVSSDHFEEMRDITSYKNRRSATSAIINTPKNLHLAKYITIIPLIWYDENHNIRYAAPYRKIMNSHLVNIPTQVFRMIDSCKTKGFPYRTDGVVLFPMVKIGDKKMEDIMEDSIAYKINTAVAKTKILYAYMSVGRTGQATPMIHVEKCDVNETEVTDISLSTIKKFIGMQFHEGEVIEIFSAGDVIPQAKCLSPKLYPVGSPLLSLDMSCPYCGHELQLIGDKCFCMNEECLRLAAGEIIIFITKLGVEGISDATIETLYKNKIIQKRADVFQINPNQIKALSGFDELSANNIVNEFKRIRSIPIPAEVFLGSLNIKGISIKMCERILEKLSLDEILSLRKDDLRFSLYGIDGFGPVRADTFIDYILSHEDEIWELMSFLNISATVKKVGNVVFTGFRDSEWSQKFNEIRVPYSSAITKQTLAVITTDYNTKKAKKAREKRIPVYLYKDMDDAYQEVMERVKEIEEENDRLIETQREYGFNSSDMENDDYE